jgi:UDP-3-O-[3-hydroxymyristoyl] glucosamine N-acyltransferase
LGRCCVLVAQVGISGSTVLEDFVQMGGQSGVSGHIHIGRGAKVAARGGIMHDVPAGSEMGGFPAQPARVWMREIALVRRMIRSQGRGKTPGKKTE